MIGMVRTAVGTCAGIIADAIDTSPTARRDAEAAATEAAAQRLITPAVSLDGDDIAAPPIYGPRSARTERSRVRVERLLGSKL